MLKVAICDDSEATIAQLENILARIPLIVGEYDTFESGKEILLCLEGVETKYDIFILAKEMQDMDGLLVARGIRSLDKRALIIFLTDRMRCGANIFEVRVFDFLSKPVSLKRIRKVLERAKQYLNLMDRPFYFSFNRTRHALENKEIFYFEKVKRKVYIYTEEIKYEANLSMKEVWNRVEGEGFVAIAYSYYVNMEYIAEMNSREIVLRNRQHLPISRKYKRTAKGKYKEFLQSRVH